MIFHYVRDHNYKPPQVFIDDVMDYKIKDKSSQCWGKQFYHRPSYNSGSSFRSGFKSNESSMPILPGPKFDTEVSYNPTTNKTYGGGPGVINRLNTEVVKDEYFDTYDKTEEERIKERKRKRKRMLRFREFEATDYRDVTGRATTSGYVGDRQILTHGTNLISTLPRSQWNEPETIIIGFDEFDVEDPYFLKKRRKGKRPKETYRDRKRNKKSRELNKFYKIDNESEIE